MHANTHYLFLEGTQCISQIIKLIFFIKVKGFWFTFFWFERSILVSFQESDKLLIEGIEKLLSFILLNFFVSTSNNPINTACYLKPVFLYCTVNNLFFLNWNILRELLKNIFNFIKLHIKLNSVEPCLSRSSLESKTYQNAFHVRSKTSKSKFIIRLQIKLLVYDCLNVLPSYKSRPTYEEGGD